MHVGKGSSRYNEKMWGKEMGKRLTEEGHRYYCFMEGYPIYIGTAFIYAILSDGKNNENNRRSVD